MKEIVPILKLTFFFTFVTYAVGDDVNRPIDSTTSLNVNRNFIHHIVRHHSQSKDHETTDDINQQIFINQSNNIHILAKHGQTVNLPCLVFKQKHHDLSNVI